MIEILQYIILAAMFWALYHHIQVLKSMLILMYNNDNKKSLSIDEFTKFYNQYHGESSDYIDFAYHNFNPEELYDFINHILKHHK